MKKGKAELVGFRLKRVEEASQMTQLSIENKFWNSAATHLYYTCFYLIQALLADKGLEVKTHKGLKAIFAQEFITTGILDVRWGKLVSKLFNLRQMGDYGDITPLSEQDVLPFIQEVNTFKTTVNSLLQKN